MNMNTEIYVIERYSEALDNWCMDAQGYYNYEAAAAQVNKEIEENKELSYETKEKALKEIDIYGYSDKAGIWIRTISIVDSEVM